MEKYVLRQQLNNRGCYSSISFDVTFNPSESSNLLIIYEAESMWESACKAGINIFFDYFKRSLKGQLIVKIVNIDWIPIDTNNLIILFSTVKGLSEVLDFKIKHLEIDLMNEYFIFPETRSCKSS